MREAGLGRTALSAREVERAGVLRRVKEGKLKLLSAAQLLGISPRQAKRLWKCYQEQGIQGLQHRATGRRSNRAKPEKFRTQVLALVRDKYSGGDGGALRSHAGGRAPSQRSWAGDHFRDPATLDVVSGIIVPTAYAP